MNKQGISEVGDVLNFASEWLTDSMLLSAYDIHYGHVPKPENIHLTPEITVVDSGGYEARIEHDLSATVHTLYSPKEWTNAMLCEVYDSWPVRLPAIFVSFDHPAQRKTFAEQIEIARILFSKYPNQLHTILLKPLADTQQFLSRMLAQVAASADELSQFDMVGVTEKELGHSMLDRMLEIAKLRLAMDEAGVMTPIHVFGALDPVSSCLYFLAGAEVFDGLTWLRYAYRDGLCVYQSNHGALSIGCDMQDKQVRAQTLTSNVHYLRQLRAEMRRFTLDGDFAHFKFHQEVLRNEYDSLRTKLKGRI